MLNCCLFPSCFQSLFLCLHCLSFDLLSFLFLLAYFVFAVLLCLSYVISVSLYVFLCFSAELLSFFLCFCVLFFTFLFFFLFASFVPCFFPSAFLDFAWSIFFASLGQVNCFVLFRCLLACILLKNRNSLFDPLNTFWIP